MCASFPDRTSAEPIIDRLEGFGFAYEHIRREGVRVQMRDDGSVAIVLTLSDSDRRLEEMLERAGATVTESPT